jgi:dolichyl-phosphate beta-glucosyltransferase
MPKKTKSKPKKKTEKKNVAIKNNLVEELMSETAAKNDEVILSVIIPAYKEEKRIGNTLLSLDKYLSPLGFNYEIIVVIDGSPDNTFSVVEKYQKMIKNLYVINNPENHGKGYVVRQGLLVAKGVYRLFMDADNSVTINQIENFSPHFEDKEVGIVIGSRDIKGADIKKHQAKWKEMLGDMGNFAIKMLTGLWGIPDTQCGFKILTAEAAELVCPLMTVDRFGFDFEMLTLIKKVGFKIAQAPVVWINDEASTVTLFGPNGYINVLKDLCLLRLRLWMGKYDIKGALEKKNAGNATVQQ